MSKIRIVKGNIVKNSQGSVTLDAMNNNFQSVAATTNNWHGEEGGIIEASYIREAGMAAATDNHSTLLENNT